MRNIIGIVLLVIFVSAVQAQKKSILLDSLFHSLQKEKMFNGNMLVMDKGKVYLEESYGLKDYSKEISLDSNSVFHLADASSMFTAVAIMQLKEKGLLNYSDPINQYLKEIPFQGIKIKHLLTHTSGLPKLESLFREYKLPEELSNDDVRKAVILYPYDLEYKPGENYRENLVDYVLLALIIEKASGITCNEYLQTRIFDLAQMKHTHFYNSKAAKKNQNIARSYVYYPPVARYEERSSIPEFSYLDSMDKLFGCCNIYSTVQDLFLFYRSLVAGRLVSPAILEDALIPVELNDATQTNQAYGFEIIASNSGFAVYSEGDIPGNSTAILWKPKRNELIILCSNDNYPGLNYNNEIIKSVATILADGKLNIPRKSVCFEIMKNILVWSDKELENNFNSMVSNTKRYYLDKQELRNIGEKLKDKGEKDKADFLMNVAKKYSDQK